jgi:TolB-like protein/class 3 adenylate cyclase/Flp pilus assembly protein TadD
MTATRRLAAILAADVAGYSRLIGADEGGTLQALKAIRAELIDPTIASHNGRLVKTTGDGLLVEFGSVVDALQCATEVQAGMAQRNANAPTPADKRIEFRIGINMGDIVVEDGDIFGDGVNIAARLEGLAEPGGICVSARVQEDATGKLDLAFEDIGEQQLKNIARPMRVYAMRPEALADLPAPSVRPAPSISQPPVAPRLSIVVLPFANLGNDPEQQYFADGITEDLTTDLSRISDMFVISRNTAFTYQGKRIDTKQIGRELGVRYLLEGSVRRSGNQIRVNAQLIDAETDAHLWAERFDGDMSDLFAVQSEVTSWIANALNLELINVEAARPTERPDVLDYVLRARAAWNRPNSRERHGEVISLYEQALALDPRSVEAQAGLAANLAGRATDNLSDTPAADIERAETLVRQAAASAPRNPNVRWARGQVLRAQRRFAEAIPEYEAVLAANRNAARALCFIGQCKLFTGAIEETIPLLERAMRLSPHEPRVGIWCQQVGRAHLLQSRTEEAVAWFEKARNDSPAHPIIRVELASAYALNGETERAAAELAEARRLSADDRFSSLARLRAFTYRGVVPKIRALYDATFFVGLRLAGMPEE